MDGGITSALAAPAVTDMSIVESGYSPLTLILSWPSVARLLIMALLSFTCIILCGFFLGSFFVEKTLNKIGYVFLALAGLADFIASAVLMSIVTVIILSGQWATYAVCHWLQFLLAGSTYCYVLYFALAATESYYRLCRPLNDYEWFITARIGFLCTSVFAIGFTAAAVGVWFDLDYDYCQRLSFGNHQYRLLTSILFYAVPSLITFIGLIAAFVGVIRRTNCNPHYRRSEQSDIDYTTCIINIMVYLTFVTFWAPYLIVTYLYPDVDDGTFYLSTWFALCRPLFTTSLYVIFVKNFRRAFVNIFNYCFCKNSLPGTSDARDSTVEYRVASGDVRVNLLAPTRRPPLPRPPTPIPRPVSELLPARQQRARPHRRQNTRQFTRPTEQENNNPFTPRVSYYIFHFNTNGNEVFFSDIEV